MAVSRPKNPVLSDAGRRGALKRWGPPGTRVVRLGELTGPQRQVVIALVEAHKSANAAREGGDDAA